jgi:anti-sigma factor ChrR (cupin superfamily)
MMDIQELLPLYALGILDPEERSAVERALADQPHLAADLDEFRATVGELSSMVEPIAPSDHVRRRLMISIGGGRFERFLAQFTKIFDLTAEAGRELLAWIEDPTKWEAMCPTAQVIHFSAGPACGGADTRFVRVAPGGTFPYHGHGGTEVTLVLAGSAITSDGKVLQLGDEVLELAGSAHDITNAGDDDFIYATRVYDVDHSVPKPT